MGRIDRVKTSRVIWTSFAASSKCVVRAKIRVPTAYERKKAVVNMGSFVMGTGGGVGGINWSADVY